MLKIGKKGVKFPNFSLKIHFLKCKKCLFMRVLGILYLTYVTPSGVEGEGDFFGGLVGAVNRQFFVGI